MLMSDDERKAWRVVAEEFYGELISGKTIDQCFEKTAASRSGDHEELRRVVCEDYRKGLLSGRGGWDVKESIISA